MSDLREKLADRVRSVAPGPGGRVGFGGRDDGGIRVRDLRKGELARAFAGDGRLIFSGGSDGKAKVWDGRTGEPLHVLPGHLGGVGAIVSSSDGKLLASGGYDRTIKTWRKTPGFTGARPAGLSPRSSSPDLPPGPAPGRPPALPD